MIVVLPATDKLDENVTFPVTFAVPATVNVASGDAVLTPTLFVDPSTTNAFVFTTRPFLTTKSLSAILVPFPRGYFLLFMQ